MKKFRTTVLFVCAVSTLFISGCAGTQSRLAAIRVGLTSPELLALINQDHQPEDVKRCLGSWLIGCSSKSDTNNPVRFIYYQSSLVSVNKLPIESTKWSTRLLVERGDTQKKITLHIPSENCELRPFEKKTVEVATTPK